MKPPRFATAADIDLLGAAIRAGAERRRLTSVGNGDAYALCGAKAVAANIGAFDD